MGVINRPRNYNWNWVIIYIAYSCSYPICSTLINFTKNKLKVKEFSIQEIYRFIVIYIAQALIKGKIIKTNLGY